MRTRAARGTPRALAFVLVLIVVAILPAAAFAAFPYKPKGPPGEYSRYFLDPGEVPNDYAGKLDWMYAASPEPNTTNLIVNQDPRELNGVRGASIVDRNGALDTAWKTTTGRPDVTIAVLDSGIKWNDVGAMRDLRKKTRLNAAELPTPTHQRTVATEPELAGIPAPDCASYADRDDANGDGVFNVVDYACDLRVSPDPPEGVGGKFAAADGAAAEGKPMLDPQDVLIALSDDRDGDGNGFRDDIVGWDFLDDDNDPYDDVQYGHGTGEARDSAGEADNAGDLGACPNCMQIHMRVGDSFVADANSFAEATIYAADNDALVVQEALGTLNNSQLATQAIDYAYRHGVTVIASAADEAAQHNNWPSSNPHVILVNSIVKYPSQAAAPNTPGRSYLQVNGCTNFNSKITLAIPSVSCSSDATGRAAGMAGLVYAAALNAREAGALEPHPSCRLTNSNPCPLSANEVRQLMASGTIGGRLQSDDVNFTAPGTTEPSCASTQRSVACTDPFLSNPTVSERFSIGGRSYPARGGHDQFYGYGRVNMNRAVKATRAATIPPEAEIGSPDWYAFVDPAQPSLDVRGQVGARGRSYSCRVLVAPGSYPNNAEVPSGDFKAVPSQHCNGDQRAGESFSGVLATLDLNDLKSRFPSNAMGFNGREPGVGTTQTASGRPNIDPYGFVVKVVATVRQSVAGQDMALTGEDRRNLRLHRDADMMAGFPSDLGGDGASSPVFIDLDGDNRNELVIGGSDGFVHAYRPDLSELRGWPVRVERLSLHTDGRAFKTAEVSSDFGGAILGSVAAGDLDRDGVPEVVVTDLEGRVSAFRADGRPAFTVESEIKYSGKPLRAFENVRKGRQNRTQHGFIASPVLADIDRDDGGRLEIVAAAMDRHVYAWNHDGTPVRGYPVLVVDRTKVASIDPQTHAVRFDPAKAGPEIDQGAIIDTPAVGDITGDGSPEIVVGTNEAYEAGTGNEGPQNSSATNAFGVNILQEAALTAANTRLYALPAEGDADGDPSTDPAYPRGWPVKLAQSGTSTLPVVGEGVTGNPVIGPVDCPFGGGGAKVGAVGHAGPVFLLNANGTSCYGEEGGRARPLQSDGKTGADQTDTPVLNAFGHPAFVDFGDGGLTLATPALGATRALDIALPEYQGGQDFIAAWSARTGQFRPNFPARTNDLQFLTGPSAGDLDGQPGEEIVGASASLDLQGYTASGTPINDRWPKLTSDWVVANPLIGSFGTLDIDASARKTVFEVTRSGFMLAYRTAAPACSPSSWPRFHHDNANSGDARRDAVSPGAPPTGVQIAGGDTLSFTAPGDDLLCGRASAYEIATSDSEITPANFSRARRLDIAAAPKPAGQREDLALPSGVNRFVAVRAVDDQGNVGRPAANRPAVGQVGVPRASGRCLTRSGRVSSRGIGRVRIGQRSSTIQRRAGRPSRRGRRSLRYCVRGGGKVLVALSPRRRARLVVTTSRRVAARRVGRGSSLRTVRRAYRRLRRVGPGLYATRRGSRVLIGVRRGRVRYVAVVDRGLARNRRDLRRHLRLVRL